MNVSKLICVSVLFFSALSHSVAKAQGGSGDLPIVTVTNLTSSPTITRQFHTDGSSEWSITIAFSGATTGNPTIRVAPVVNNQRLRQVLVTNNGSSIWALLQIDSGSGGIMFDYAKNVLWDTGSNRGILLSHLLTHGDVGNIVVNSINGGSQEFVDIGGDLTGDITIHREPGNGFGSGSVINMIVRGDFLGDIDAPSGSGWDFWIQKLEVGGDIGSISDPIAINTRGDIQRIIAGGSIYADIDATAYEDGELGRIEAAGGDFVGSLTGKNFADFGQITGGVFVENGDLDADIALVEELTHDIIVGGSFVSGREIDLPAGGLQAQIVFNNLDDGGEWDGDVLIDGVALSAQPHYTNTAASIGGGAAGLAPFTHHGTSCVPTDGATIFIKSLDIFDPEEGCLDHDFTQAKVRLYGPVELVGAAPHVEVLVWSGSAYVDAGFTIVTSIVSSTGEREVLVKRSGDLPWPEGEYRIVPLEDKMTSKGVVGDPDVDMFEYEFTLADGCQLGLLQNFDFNEDETVCEEDFLTWSSDPCDLNDDEVVDCDDIALLLSAIDLYQIQYAE